ncbi:MAG: isoprenyl transferase [Rhodospirillaceae bacterium]|jgi:undecaprenyl diphosphate synthase|nr:isoprenyl transferase [Rhodospirillaceae bacterium]MBT6305670.1 isoprenyl transferase [Rhodospirillaceae bacterium]MBT7731881.1 isoprenyl transferase [Rhodospirillaceae bacterium]MDC1442039.1 isoprenyl transferase [Rhodospirillaceae bacterium]
MKLQTTSTEASIPKHVAIIMDGNGRWAKSRGLPRAVGHKKGAEVVKTIVESALSLNVKYLTLFGFSSENWNRPADEVIDLMSLLRNYLSKEINNLDKKGIVFKVIGDRNRLDPDIVEMIKQSEFLTRGNTELTLTLALSYGGRRAIVAAAQELASQVSRKKLNLNDINEEVFNGVLETKTCPDPDLIIRTSGEKRISNFMLWECAYSEFVFTDTLWPDFSHSDFNSAIDEFTNRNRRFGA